MFVTTDTFDLAIIGAWNGYDWRENLLGGVGLHGSNWRGVETDAAFLLQAAERCGLREQMRWASYTPAAATRSRPIKPASLVRLSRSELAGAVGAESVLLTGVRAAPGTRQDVVVFGGTTHGGARYRRTRHGPEVIDNYKYSAFDSNFVFPTDGDGRAEGEALLRLAATALGAEYGYFFLRDAAGEPTLYASGIGTLIDGDEYEESLEIANWWNYCCEGLLWTDPFPLMRDLFAINLLSRRHTHKKVAGLGYLPDWITAARGRGSLEDLGEGRVLWSLADQELYHVRLLLNAAGLLKSCRPRVYRDLDPALSPKPKAAPWCYVPRWRQTPA